MKKLKKKSEKKKSKVKSKVAQKRKVKVKAAVKKKAAITKNIKKTAPKKTVTPKKSSISKAKPDTVKTKVEITKKATGQIKVLSVDDEEVICFLLKKVLTKAGYEVALAASGEEGLKLMKKKSFDLAIIDLKMPGMGGIAFLEKIKNLYPNTEAIILTGFGDIDIAVDAMKKGAFNFLPKPFKRDVFLTIISMALERRTMKTEMEEAKTTIREMENNASQKIGELEGQLIAVEHAKQELGEQFNSIKKVLLDGTGSHSDLEKKVMSLEKVAQQIKAMEEKVVAAESKKKGALRRAKNLGEELNLRISGNIELGNNLSEAKSGLEKLKKETHEEAAPAQKEESTSGVSLTDIHQALADFRKENET